MAVNVSLETKLIVASNMAVAHAILELAASQQHGQPMMTTEKRVVGFISSALKDLDALAEKT